MCGAKTVTVLHGRIIRGDFMKNRKKAVFAVAGMGLILAACSGRTSETVASGEMVAPEMSSEDLLVSSLEYLLLDEEDAVQDSQEQAADVIREQEAAAQESGENNDYEEIEEPTAQQGDSAQAEAVIYYGNGGSHELNRETIELEEIIPEELVNALAKHNIVSLDTKVISFEEEQQDAGKVLHLDLSKAAAEYLRTMSREAECIIVASITNTFLENYDADTICLTVNGEPLTSAHRVYEEGISECTPEELLEVLTADGFGTVSEDTIDG